MTDQLTPQLAALTPQQRRALALRMRERARQSPSGAPAGPVPLSYAQERLWFLDQLDPGDPAYNIPFAVRITGHLDAASLDAALGAVIQRHDALRTVFTEAGSGPQQIVREPGRAALPVTDLRSGADPRAEADRIAAKVATHRFDLAAGPPLLSRLLQLADEEYLLLGVAHHIVFDGWSSEVLVTDLIRLYGQFAGGEPAGLPVLRGSLRQHAVQERQDLTGEVLGPHLDYWRDRLAGAPGQSTVPPDLVRPARQDHRACRRQASFRTGLARDLSALARELRATLNSVVLAAMAATVHRAGGGADLLLGVPVAGRGAVELEAVVGCFANTLVIRTHLDPQDSVAGLIHQTQRSVSSAYAHQVAPYARVVEAVAPARDRASNPLFQIMVNVSEIGADGVRIAAGASFSTEDVATGHTDFDLFLTLQPVADDLVGYLDYDSALYLEETADDLLTCLGQVLAQFAEQPQRPLCRVPALRRRTVALATTFSAGPLIEPLGFWFRFLREPADLEDAPYGQLVQHLLSALPGDATVACLRWDDWLRHWTGEAHGDFLEAVFQDLEQAVRAFRARSAAPLLLVLCPPSPRWDGLTPVFTRLDDLLMRRTRDIGGVHVVFAGDWVAPAAVNEIFDAVAEEVGHIPYTAEFFASIARGTIRRLLPLLGSHWPRPGSQRAAYISSDLEAAAAVVARAAPAPLRAIAGQDPVVGPRTGTERRLAEIWQNALGTGEIGVTSDFFALGGHSLLAARLVSTIRSEFGRNLTLHAFLTHPTIEALARILDGRTPDGDAPAQVVPVPRDGEPALSSTQLRAWVLAQLADAPEASNTAYAARLTGPLDEAALRAALTEVIRRHEVLRTAFGERAGTPAPVIKDTVDPWLPSVDLRGHDPGAAEQAVLDLVRRDVSAPFELRHGPLIRARLIRESGDARVLVIGMHHAVCDLSSWRIFLGELTSAYNAALAGEPARLEPLAVQFADYAAWQRAWLTGAAAARQAGYWRDHLAGAPPVLDLHRARPRPARRTGQAAGAVHRIPARLGRALRALGQEEGVSLFCVLLAAVAVGLYRESGQDDLVVGTPSRGRDQPELAGLIGYFADLLPLRVNLGGRITFRQLLQRVRATLVDAVAHQDLPFLAIVDTLRAARDPSYHPLFQCVINYVDQQEPEPALTGLVTQRLAVPQAATDFDLFLTAGWDADELVLDVSYATDILDAEAARGLLASFEETIAACLDRPDAAIAPQTGQAGQAGNPDLAVTMMSSFPAGDLADAAEALARRLGVPLSIDRQPAGSVFRPLLDGTPAAGRPAAGPAVLLVRWEDLLGASLAPGHGTLAAAVWHAEDALADLLHAIAAFRDRSAVPILVVTCPPSTPWIPLAAVLAGLDGRLSREASRIPSVEVITAGPPPEPDGPLAAVRPADPLAGLGRQVALRILHGLGYSPRWVALDPRCWPVFELGRLVTSQARYGRRVILAGPAEPGSWSARDGGVLQLGAGLAEELPGLIAARQIEVTAGLVLAPDRPTADRLRSLLPGPAVAIILPDAAPGSALTTSGAGWLLDPPLGTPEPRPWPDRLGQGSPADPCGRAAGTTAPRTGTERLLASTWADLLHVDEVGVHDNFFDLGGDSMLAVEAAYRAVEAGLLLTPRLIRDHPTVSTLAAAVAGRREAETPAILPDEAPLAPAQQWYLDAVAPGSSHVAHFNHPYYLQLAGQVDPDTVRQALGEMAARHDSLRLRLHRDGRGIWRQSCGPADQGMAFETASFSDLPAAEREPAMTRAAAAAQGSLSLDGPLVRALHLRPGHDQGDRLLIVAHHLVTDGVSQGILFEELRRLIDPSGGRVGGLPSTTPYLTWARQIYQYAQSARLRAQLPFWLEQRSPPAARIPMDLPGPFTFGTADRAGFALTSQETTGLLDLARRRRLQVNDLLAWAVTGLLADWTGQEQCALALTGHGREDLGGETDLSRTTGWFQVFYPLRFTVPSNHRDLASAACIAQQLAGVPDNGLGWSALRYLCEDVAVREQIEQIPLPRVSFNYMGHFNFKQTSRGGDVFDICRAPYGLEQEPDAIAPFDLDFVASMVGAQLHVEINYSQNCHLRKTAEWVLAEIRDRLLRATRSAT